MEFVEKHTVDVLICGAGPAGLMMACQLAMQNISFRIIDLKTSPVVHSGALIVHARTLEIFHQMGVAEKAMNAGTIARSIKIRFCQTNNYTMNIDSLGKDLTRFPSILMLEQWQTENILIEFLGEHGHSIENNTKLISFIPENEFVNSEILKPDGTVEQIKSKFLIGADGNNSFVRKQLNIPFPGKTQKARLFITDCKASLSESSGVIYFSFTSTYTSGFFPLPQNRWRVDGLIPAMQKNDRVSFDDVQNFFGSNQSLGIEMKHPQWFSVFRSHSRCASSYSQGRCYLVGDAAHVHSPVGGQGMNTGLQDAHNLAWKLAFFIKWKASENLLATYQEERRPIALGIIRYTDFAYSFMTSNLFLVRFFRLQVAPFILPMFLRQFQKQAKLRSRIFTSISGIGVKYKQSLLIGSGDREEFAANAPKPGDRLPWLTYEMDGKTCNLYDDLNTSTFHLFIFGELVLSSDIKKVTNKYNYIISVKYITKETGTQQLFNELGLENEGCFLVRPDLIIAWRSHKIDPTGLRNYLEKFVR